MSEDTRYIESCESLRYCEDYGGQPRDFPKKMTVTLPKPEVKPYPVEETWQYQKNVERSEEYDSCCKCCTCKNANGTPVCNYWKKQGAKTSLSSEPMEASPENGCIVGYLPDWHKVFPNMRRVVL